MLTETAFLIAGLTILVFLPGLLWARLIVPEFVSLDPIEKFAVALGVGIAVVPSFLYFVNQVLIVPLGTIGISISLIFLTGTALLLEGLRRVSSSRSGIRRALQKLRELTQ